MYRYLQKILVALHSRNGDSSARWRPSWGTDLRRKIVRERRKQKVSDKETRQEHGFTSLASAWSHEDYEWYKSYPVYIQGVKWVGYYRQTSEILQIPDHRNKVKYHNKASCSLFASGGSYFRFVKNTTLVGCNKAKHNKTGYACVESHLLELLEGGP